MIYILTISMLAPGTPNGFISDLFEDAFTDVVKAERVFKDFTLTNEYFRKELWVKEPVKEERYIGP